MFRIYIRLLAGKFGAVCTEFSLATFSAKILKRLPLKITAKNNETASRAKKCTRKRQFLLRFFQKMVWLDNVYLLAKVFLDYNYLHEMCGSF